MNSTFFETYGYEYEVFVETMKLFKLANEIQFYILIVNAFIAVFGNSISIAVYLGKEFRKNSLGTYFAVHSIIDMVFILALLIAELQQFLFPQYALFCQLVIFAQSFSQFSTSWIQVTNSIDRTVLITMPKKMLFLRKLNSQICILILIFIASALLTIPNLLNISQGVLEDKLTCFSGSGIALFYYYVSVLTIYAVVPFIVMLVCSIIIIVTLSRKGSLINHGNERKQRDRMLAKTLLASNCYYLAVMLPYGVVSAIRYYMSTFELIFFVFHQGQYAVALYIVIVLIEFYHSTMIFVHLYVNKIYRKVVNEFVFKHFKIKLFKAA